MEAARRTTLIAAVLALVAALLWSSYYFFVLDLQARGVGNGPITVYPFASGGVAYLGYCLLARESAPLRGLLRDGSAYLRIGMLIAMQLLVLAGTYSLGAVDTSLLTLVGDVVLSPFLVLFLFREGRERLRSPYFLSGVLACTAGATLAIVAGGAARSVSGAEWGIALAMPIAIAAYFVWTARLGRRIPTSALVTHATLGAAILGLIALPFLPAQGSGPWVTDPVDLLLLLVNGVVSFFLGPLLYFRAIRIAGIILPSVLMATIPVFTLLLAVVVLGSFPPLLGALGIPVALGGAYLAMRGETGSEGAETEGSVPGSTRSGE